MLVQHARRAAALAAVALVLTTAALGDDSARKPQVPDLKVVKFTLPNGLDVILHEDHTTPIVGVNLWYKVGSKNEKVGRTGFAHLFEHLMFQGSEHHDKEYFGPIEKIGADINGSTNNDRTNYFETLPSNALELALWLESDRMGFLLPALTQAKLDNQRDVVKNERRQRVDNVPYGLPMEKLDETLYPPDHPYHHSVIGSMADLSAASLTDVSGFFRTYYAPNNASLVIAGDIDVSKARALVEKYFGPIPRGPEVKALKPRPVKLDGPKHLKMTDRATMPLARLVWPGVARGHKDEPALDVLASVLGQLDKENRLYRALIYDRQVAAQVQAADRTSDLAGEFDVFLLARPGQSLDELVKLADAEIDRLKADGPTADEVRRAKNADESTLILGLQAPGRKADFLNAMNVDYGDPLAYKAEMQKLFDVTPGDVKRVAKQYLTADRVRLDVTPGPPTPRAPEVAVDRSQQPAPESPAAVAVKDGFDRSVMPRVGPPPGFAPPPVARRKLSNGLEVVVAERHALPILTMQLVVKGGETLVPADKQGLAGLTAALLTEGTASRDSLKLAGDLAEIGAKLNTEGGLESSGVGLTTLTKHAPRALELYADVILHPAFPDREVNRLKLRRLAAIKARADQPASVGQLVFNKVLYGEGHPYGRSVQGTLKSVESITRDDVSGFYEKVYRPGNASLIVVGDVSADAFTAELEKALSGWKAGGAVKAALPEHAATGEGVTVYLVDKPGAAQSFLAVGEVGVPRRTEDYVPLTVMNAVVGGQFSSRINLNLREDKGYSYGAHSGFTFRLGPGPFMAGGSVETGVTKEAVSELVKELTDVTGKRSITDAELEFAKDRIVRGFPGKFESTSEVADTLAELVIYDLPADEFTTYQARVSAVTKADADRVARKYLHPDRMAVVVVGDRAKVEGPLKSLPFVKVVTALDPEGNPLPAPAGERGVK